jgi:hypothetical protein
MPLAMRSQTLCDGCDQPDMEATDWPECVAVDLHPGRKPRHLVFVLWVPRLFRNHRSSALPPGSRRLGGAGWPRRMAMSCGVKPNFANRSSS